MPSYLLSANIVIFDNRTFQVEVNPVTREVSFGFGDEYGFDVKDLNELLAFLIKRELVEID